jgi:hypothetical protein
MPYREVFIEPIRPRFFASNNYNITFQNGIFSITAAPPVLTVAPNASIDALGRPIISLADRTLNPNPFFLPFIVSGLNTDIGLLASGASLPAGGTPSAQNLANIEPAGGLSAEDLANIEPAAGGDDTPQNQAGGSDIECANSFLDNKPCQDANI